MSYNKETGMYEGYIYKIVNKTNQHMYIGQTLQTIQKRWCQHKTDSKNFDYPIYRAMRKYGKSSFDICEIEKVENVDRYKLSKILDVREIFWINYYDTYRNGYNQTIGGQNNAPNKFTERPVNEYTLHGKLLYTYKSITDSADANGFSRSDITSCCLRQKVHRVKNRIFRYTDSPLTDEEIKYYISKYPKINKFLFDGTLVNSYDFLKDAVIDLKEEGYYYASSCNITDVCKGKEKHAYGYVWRYNEDAFNKYEIPRMYVIEQRTLKGDLINTYNSFIEAAEKTNSNKSCINRCCNGFSQYHNNFIWCYVGKYDDSQIIKIKEKPVSQYTLDGNFINSYRSIKEASEKLILTIIQLQKFAEVKNL